MLLVFLMMMIMGQKRKRTISMVSSSPRHYYYWYWWCSCWWILSSSSSFTLDQVAATTSTDYTREHYNNQHHFSNYDYDFIIEGTLPSYFSCIQQNQRNANEKKKHTNISITKHPPTSNTHNNECSVSRIQKQQQHIFTSLQKQRLLSYTKSNTTTRSRVNMMKIIHIQRMDASYQIINALYLRITIQMKTAAISQNHHSHHIPSLSEEDIRIFVMEQYQTKIYDIQQIYISSSSSPR